MELEYFQITKLITPAIIIALTGYLINFFGKVIADQQSFADDRSWYIQLHGSLFVLNIIFGGIIGVYFANVLPFGVDHWWIHLITFFVFTFLSAALLFNTAYKGSQFYNYNKVSLKDLDNKTNGAITFFSNIGRYVPVGVLPIAVFYFGTLEYISGNKYWIIITIILGFFMFVWSAVQYSLNKVKDISPVDVYFLNGNTEPLQGVHVLKINDDNIRIRSEDKIIILNKDQVLKIEMKIPEKHL